MSHLRTDRILVAASALVLAAIAPSVVSCAEAEPPVGSDDDASIIAPEASVDGGPDADADVHLDAGCRPSDPDCVTHQLSCEEAAWCPVPTTVSTLYTLTAIWGSGEGDVWAVGSGGTIIHYDGTAWVKTPTEPATLNTFRAVWGSGPTDVWAVSRTDVIFHTTGFANGAAAWSPEPGPGAALPEQRSARAVWGTGPGDVRIGFEARFLFDPTPAYYNQAVRTSAPDGSVSWGLARGDGFVLGFWGTATDAWYVADNVGVNGWQRSMTVHGTPGPRGELEWVAVENQSTSTLEAVWGSGPNDVWAVGAAGTIRHYDGGAPRWSVVESPTTEALHGVWGTGPGDVWAVGDNGTILHFDGTSWKRSTAAFAIGRKPRLAGIWGSGANDVWIVGDAVALHFTGPKPGVQESEP